jgi:hypothetical protein
MTKLAADGRISNVQGPSNWLWRYYTYMVTVYCPWTQRIEVGSPHTCSACIPATTLTCLAHLYCRC